MGAYLITFGLASASVCLWTLRIAITSRGKRAAGAMMSTVEATVYVVAVSHVLGSLDAPVHIAMYGLGVGVGTYAGLVIDSAVGDGRPAG